MANGVIPPEKNEYMAAGIAVVVLLIAISVGFTWLLVFVIHKLTGWPETVDAGTVLLVWLGLWALKVLLGGKRNG